MDLSRVASIIAEHGAAMTLKRAGQSDLAVRGKRFGTPTENEVAGSYDDQGFSVKISNSEILQAGWPGPPVPTDVIEIDGRPYVVATVDTRSDGDAVALHTLQVSG